jgi:hypothetical protein
VLSVLVVLAVGKARGEGQQVPQALDGHVEKAVVLALLVLQALAHLTRRGRWRRPGGRALPCTPSCRLGEVEPTHQISTISIVSSTLQRTLVPLGKYAS